jgi:hypothetical protein
VSWDVELRLATAILAITAQAATAQALVGCCAEPTPNLSGASAPLAPSLSTGAVPSSALRPTELEPRLVLQREHNIAPGGDVDGMLFGGISALVLDPTERQLFALSDGRAANGPSRMFVIDVASLRPTRALALGGALARDDYDLEGLARWPRGGLLASTEGDMRQQPRRPPQLWQVGSSDCDACSAVELPVPDAYLPEPRGEQRKGVRHNMGLEGLTASPSGRRIFLACEQALLQDGPKADFQRGTRVRISTFDAAMRPLAQFTYLTDPLRRSARAGEVTAYELGVSALAALDDHRLLVMERGAEAVDGVFQNQVRIYQVDLTGADDITERHSLVGVTPLPKQLVLDLDSIIPELDPRYGRLDNFEAMALTSNGSTLFIASDDNFSQDQRTAILVFALR